MPLARAAQISATYTSRHCFHDDVRLATKGYVKIRRLGHKRDDPVFPYWSIKQKNIAGIKGRRIGLRFIRQSNEARMLT